MPIPALTADGILPPGVHACTLPEIKAAFGSATTNRSGLFTRLESFMGVMRASGLIRHVLVDGSFTTDRHEPGDIDLIAVLPGGHDWNRDIDAMVEYKAVNRSWLKKTYGFDVFVDEADSRAFQDHLQLFLTPNPKYHLTLNQVGVEKGILQVTP